MALRSPRQIHCPQCDYTGPSEAKRVGGVFIVAAIILIVAAAALTWLIPPVALIALALGVGLLAWLLFKPRHECPSCAYARPEFVTGQKAGANGSQNLYAASTRGRETRRKGSVNL